MSQKCAKIFVAVAAAGLIIANQARSATIRDHRNASQGGDVWEPTAAFVTDVIVHLDKGRTVVFETANLSPGADPILHLLPPGASADGPVSQVAMDDDSGGNLNARLRYTPPSTGDYRLILRAAHNWGEGTCELLRDGTPMFGSVRFGAAIREYNHLRAGETLTTVQLPNGRDAFPALYLLSDKGAIISRHISFGAFVRTALTHNYNRAYILAATWVPLGDTGPVRVVRNDAALSGHDPDRDGLGTELEAAIGTCSSTSGRVGFWDCSRSADPRDTDGDGISDGDELLGKMDADPMQFLPRWGADPRHKDIFIEVDYGMRNPGDPDARMSPDVARGMASAYADENESLLLPEALLHASMLNNPDMKPGVHLHLDTGVAPVRPEDATIYGDWEGHTAVPPVCDANGCHRMDAGTAYQTYMDAARKGLFHYTTTYAGGGGQCPIGAIACSWSHTSIYTAVHEFGHTLKLNHYGPDSSRPEANCKVNYPSVMSYAPSVPFEFSDGTRPPFNNVALPKLNAVPDPFRPGNHALLLRLRNDFGYLVDMREGHVDWNRDGIFQPGVVAAYSNTRRGGDCEFSSSNRIDLGQPSLHTPAIARLGAWVFVFFVNMQNRIEVLSSTPDPFHCPPGGAPGCGNTQFMNYPVSRPWNHDIASIDATRIVDGGIQKLLVMFTDTTGQLWETMMISDEPKPLFFDATRVQTARPVSEEISITGQGDHVWLAYKDPSGQIRTEKRSSATGTWGADRRARQIDNTPVPAVPESTSPAIYETPDGTLYGAFPKEPTGWGKGRIQIWQYDPTAGRWRDPGLLDSWDGSVGRSAMAWRPMPQGAALPGRLYLYWTQRNGEERSILKENWMVREPDGRVHMNFWIQHSNDWFIVHGVDVLDEPDVDDNIRIVVPFQDLNPNNQVPDGELQIRPKADGIVDLAQEDRSDWAGMGVGLCQVLVAQQGSGAIVCPPWEP